MYKYKDIIVTESSVEKIENDIIYTIENFDIEQIENIKEIDYFIENVSYIQQGKKELLELLSYTKYKLGEYLLSFQYGFESFNFNKNSTGIIYSILSLLNLNLYEQAYFIFIKNKETIIDIINADKCNANDVINILIYFSIDITLIDNVSSKIEELLDKRKKYIYILMNLIRDRKKTILKEIDYNNMNYEDLNMYKEKMSDILSMLRDLDLHQLSDLCKLKLENSCNDKDIYNMLPCDNIEKYISKILLDEIDLTKKQKNYIPSKISKYDFEDENIKIISYKSKNLVSMHFIKLKDEYLIIDCGAQISNMKVQKIEIENFLLENDIAIDKIKAIIISHAHLDHYGSLDIMQKYVSEIHMTKDTHRIINIVGKNIEIDNDKLRLKKDNDEFYIGDLKIKFFQTNHIKGSIGVFIEAFEKKIVYTGDFSFNRQSTTQYINENDFYEFQNADYLIMETTCGYKNIELPYIYNKKLFNYFINLSLKNDKKVIIPSFSIGKAQECYDLITKSTIKGNVLMDGSAIKINEYYNKIEKNIIANNELKYNKHKTIEKKYYENDIIIVSAGLIKDISLAEKYYEMALKDKNMVTILKCGPIDKYTLERKLKPYDSVDINLIDISLSSHAHYEDLIKTINMIRPKNLIMVHGKGIKMYD
ncbi:MBL fold metallo-hydrolase [Romboutsia sedimentorum]|uniref:MBL fold metallo-hydrolase n=1 Tax=Romboutsia sedimentorum TaxID=1368474 RepID=UPI0024DE251C|nr:MBL fold metallo-hydrolase [Romboutsia sedimentorum]MDK2585693.1 MBL fold metallo-hydrolase [Romboutsia sedimentorum]